MPASAAFPLILALAAADAHGARLRVEADPRLELLGVVERLAGAGGAELPQGLEDMPERFAPWKEHPAVRFLAEGKAAGRSYPGLGMALRYLGKPPALRGPLPDLAKPFIEEAGGRERIERFLVDLRDFARRSEFMRWYKQRRRVFSAYEEQARLELGKRDFISLVEDYAGPEDFRVTLAVSALYDVRFCCYMIPYPYEGPGRKNPGPYEVVTLLNARQQRQPLDPAIEGWGSRRVFGLARSLKAGWLMEVLHLYIDKAYVDHEADFARAQSLQRALGEDCSEWTRCVTRHIALAVEDRMVLELLREEQAWPATPSGDLLRALTARLKEYEADRRRYPTLASFFPRLVDAFLENAASR